MRRRTRVNRTGNSFRIEPTLLAVGDFGSALCVFRRFGASGLQAEKLCTAKPYSGSGDEGRAEGRADL